ncbi:YdaU family protein [Bartonella gliris]|uniref:YdaU family protein n=1 Tax=Bartonella gliris TaxID=3004109 RepID=UPI003872D4A9
MQHANQQETPHYESSTLPYVCWYQNDFLGGVRGMRAHEIGIYTILLNEMYARGRPLELSIERLARLCGCDKRTFGNVLQMLIQEGKILNLANGLWNKRCENVFQERAKLLEQKSFAGRSSAQKRKKINAKVQQLLNESARDAEQSSESQKGEEKETPHGVSEKQFFVFATEEEKERKAACAQLCSTHTSSQPFSSSPPLSPSKLCTNPSQKQDLTQNAAEKVRHSRGSAQSPTPSTSGSAQSPTSTSDKIKSRTATTKGQRLPDDWQADIRAAISEGLSEEQAHWQEKKFRDYWHAKSGKDALKVDWQATWRNWFRREIERIKEHQEKLAIFSSHKPLAPHCNNDDALYRTLINYSTR